MFALLYISIITQTPPPPTPQEKEEEGEFFFLHVKYRAQFIHNPASYDDPLFLTRGCCIKTALLLIDDKLAAPCHDWNSFRKYHLKQWFRLKSSMWLQHFFRASPQTVPSWRSWIGYRCKLLRWSTPWSKFFLVLEIELRDQNCPFHAVCGKILSQTAGGRYLQKTKFLSKNLIKRTWATLGFQNFTGRVMLCARQEAHGRHGHHWEYFSLRIHDIVMGHIFFFGEPSIYVIQDRQKGFS